MNDEPSYTMLVLNGQTIPVENRIIYANLGLHAVPEGGAIHVDATFQNGLIALVVNVVDGTGRPVSILKFREPYSVSLNRNDQFTMLMRVIGWAMVANSIRVKEWANHPLVNVPLQARTINPDMVPEASVPVAATVEAAATTTTRLRPHDMTVRADDETFEEMRTGDSLLEWFVRTSRR